MTTPYPFVAGAVLTAQQLNDIQNLPISDKTTSYTLAVTDAYKRTMMNSASATTITVNNSIFTVGDVIQVANKGAGTCTVTAGAGVTINTSGSLALAQYGGGYLLCLSASTFTFFNLGGLGYGAFTGGSNITDGGVTYSYLGFTASGSVVVTRAGLFDILVVAGGAGAAGNNAGGAGGGGVISKTVYLTAATYTVTIGSGGAGGLGATNSNGTQGNFSSLNVFVALGGGKSNFNAAGSEGGSGGGGWGATGSAGGATQAQQGNAGANATGGNGGVGLTSTFSGASQVYGSGGGGSGTTTQGTGGTNAGNGGANAGNGGNGTANFGGGGGGGGNTNGNGGNGGSGFVAIRAKV